MTSFHPIPGWTPSTPAIRGDEIDDLLAQHPVVAIHFWAEWNGLDPPMNRGIQEIREQFSGRVHFVSYSIDPPEHHEFCRRLGIANVPTLALLAHGRELKPIVGYSNPEDLAATIESRLSAPARAPWWEFWKND